MVTDEKPAWHRNGVYQRGKRCPLGDSVGLERNLLGVPLFVLNPKAATSCLALEHEWTISGNRHVQFRFVRDPLVPFPQAQHKVYMDALLALFANNVNAEGSLYFKMSEVYKILGKATRDSTAIKETIYRYSYCTMHWSESWIAEKSSETWHGTLIASEDMLKPAGKKGGKRTLKCKNNPTCGQDDEKWHHIKFHHAVVESVKNSHTRIFLSRVLKMGIKAEALCVYRYFYGFSDQSDVIRTIDQLMSAFAWQSERKDRFASWLLRQLDVLKLAGLVESFTIKDSVAAVKCRNIKELKGALNGKVIELPTEAMTQPRTKKAPAKKTQEISNSNLKKIYLSLKSTGSLPVAVMEAIDACIESGLHAQYAQLIKHHVLGFGGVTKNEQ